jgi:hypothetical protein
LNCAPSSHYSWIHHPQRRDSWTWVRRSPICPPLICPPCIEPCPEPPPIPIAKELPAVKDRIMMPATIVYFIHPPFHAFISKLIIGLWRKYESSKRMWHVCCF